MQRFTAAVAVWGGAMALMWVSVSTAGDITIGGYTLGPHWQRIPSTALATQPRPAENTGDPAQELLRKVYAVWTPILKPLNPGPTVPAEPVSNPAINGPVRASSSECAAPLTPLSNLPRRPNWP